MAEHGITLTRDVLPAKPEAPKHGEHRITAPEESEKCLTVDDLIAELQKLSPEQRRLPVMSEGCDCYGDVVAVSSNKAGSIVVLERNR